MGVCFELTQFKGFRYVGLGLRSVVGGKKGTSGKVLEGGTISAKTNEWGGCGGYNRSQTTIRVLRGR